VIESALLRPFPVTVAVSSLKDVDFIGHRIEYIRCPDSCKNVPHESAWIAGRSEPPCRSLDRSWTCARFHVLARIHAGRSNCRCCSPDADDGLSLENPGKEWIPLPDNLGDTAKMFLQTIFIFTGVINPRSQRQSTREFNWSHILVMSPAMGDIMLLIHFVSSDIWSILIDGTPNSHWWIPSWWPISPAMGG
jgi:hypothetical protein